VDVSGLTLLTVLTALAWLLMEVDSVDVVAAVAVVMVVVEGAKVGEGVGCPWGFGVGWLSLFLVQDVAEAPEVGAALML
jgi:hypothetical protein